MIAAHCFLVKRAENTFVPDLTNICLGSHKYIFGISKIHFFGISQIHLVGISQTGCKARPGLHLVLGGENNPDNFELWNTPFESSGHSYGTHILNVIVIILNYMKPPFNVLAIIF